MLNVDVARSVTTAPAADAVEVFVDDKPVHVDPGCTVLQVVSLLLFHHLSGFGSLCNFVCS